jgi:2',3'-cyclic-nucleotide 2'-phosphodiesterase (5'-nucleotidase family)
MSISLLRFSQDLYAKIFLVGCIVAIVNLNLAGCSSTPEKKSEPAATEPGSKTTTVFSLEPTTRQMAFFHVSDLESELVDLQNSKTWKRELKRGGIARLHTVLNALRKRTQLPTLTVAAGDTFMPAPTLHLEIDGKNAVVTALNSLDIQASAIGNHEFDLGEEYLAEFIAQMKFPYLSSTIDVTGGPLLPLTVPKDKLSSNNTWLEKNPGKILPRGKLCLMGKIKQTKNGGRYCHGGTTVGLIGATTERLRILSRVSDHIQVPNSLKDVRDRIQEQVTALEKDNVDVIFLLSHLQGIHRELQLLDHGLTGIDVVVAGGGDNKLADKGDRLLPGDSPDPLCLILDGECYPMIRKDAADNPVLFVATDGQMHYLGQLMIGFDAKGILTGFQLSKSRPWPIDEISVLELGAKTAPALYSFHRSVLAILEPKSTPFAESTFFLDGTRESIRNHETNLGNLSTDAMLWSAQQNHPDRRLTMAIRNGGGVRAPIGTVEEKTEKLIGGPIRPIDIQSAFRFDSKLVAVETTHQILVETIESSLRGAGSSQGRFPQVSQGVNLTYSTNAPEQTHLMTNGKIRKILCPGFRIRNLTVTPPGDKPIRIVYDGKVLTPKEKIEFVTLNYLTRGGDGYFPTKTRKLKVSKVTNNGNPVGEQASVTEFILDSIAQGNWNNAANYGERDPRKPDSFRRIYAVSDVVTLTPEEKKRCTNSFE